MFPDTLDGAKVIYYTDKGNYGAVKYIDGEIYDTIAFYAVCSYENDDKFCLFGCNDSCEVISDHLLNTVNECLAAVTGNITWNKK